MRLTVLTPVQVVVDCEVSKVVAEAQDGFFCLLPRHVDLVTALVPGILFYTVDGAGIQLLAVDEGTLVKCARHVRVSTRSAVKGPDLEQLAGIVEREFLELDERERLARSALARLEAGAVRGLLQAREHRGGA